MYSTQSQYYQSFDPKELSLKDISFDLSSPLKRKQTDSSIKTVSEINEKVSKSTGMIDFSEIFARDTNRFPTNTSLYLIQDAESSSYQSEIQ